jgi:ABC-type nitrate/sulfonate/bicarbonate transport system ATPase subunit
MSDLTNTRATSAPISVTQPAAATGAAPMIAFDHTTKYFTSPDRPPLEVLRDVSFSVAHNEIVAIVGQSGAGKSTLLNLAAGLMTPDSGSVRILGEDTRKAVDWRRVGYMFQDDRLLPWRIASKNVALALEAESLPAAERAQRAHEALELVGLAEFADSYPHQLSGGMRSRVALARSLVARPDVLLMDEPFSRLDAQTRGSMHRELLRVQNLRQMSILFVTHDVEEAVVLADRIVLLSPRPGRVRRQIDVTFPQPRVGTPETVALTAELRASLEAGHQEDNA